MQLARMKRSMMELLQNMPSYTCVVTLQRAQRGQHAIEYTAVDQIRYEIAHSEGREFLSRDGRPFQPESEARPAGGVVSHGEYALHAKSVFGESFTTIRFGAQETLNNRPALRWDFEIPLFGSGWRINHLGGATTIASQGSFWVTPNDLTLLRLQLNAVGLPLQYSSAATTVDYSMVNLGSRKVPLPQTATLVLGEFSGKHNLNMMEFSHCRQFVAESTLSFNTESEAKASAPHPLELPAGLMTRLALDHAIDFAKASVGEIVHSTLVADAIVKGKIILRKGDTVRGRIRRLEEVEAPPFRYAIGIELTDVESAGRRAPFFATLRRIETPIQYVMPRLPWSVKDPVLRLRDPQIYFTPAFPGVTTLLIPSPGVLPEGMIMVWI